MSAPALVHGKVNQSPIRQGFYEAVAEETQGNARGPDRLALRHKFLNLRIGKSAIRANGAIVHEGTAGDNLSPVSDRDIGVEKPVVWSQMSDPQFRDLAAAAGRRILVTFT